MNTLLQWTGVPLLSPPGLILPLGISFFTFRRSDFDAAAVTEERPDLVIHQVVERFLRLGLVPAALPPRP